MVARGGVPLHAGLSAGRTLAALAALLATSVACTATSPVGPDRTERRIALDGRPMLPCDGAIVGAVCGTLRVAEDPARPGGRTLELNVVVVPASSVDPAPDPVFFLAGGPGGAATESWATAPQTFEGVHRDRDIVLVDQRGTGSSTPLVGPPLPAAGASPHERRALAEAWFRDALGDIDADLGRFTSAEAADDLDAVRRALGYGRIDLYGGSYGATLAQYYLRRHGEHARAVVLDGGSLLDVPIFELVARRSGEALASVFARCRAEAPCRRAFPDPAGDLAAALRDLERHPATVEVRTPVSTREVTVTADAFADAIHALLVRSRSAEIPGVLARAAAHDLTDVGGLIAELESEQSYRGLMSWAIRCSEPWAVFRASRVTTLGRDSYLLGSQLAGARTTRIACAAMPRLRVPGARGPVRSDVPVLLLNGSEDPQDPPANVADAPVELTNSLSLAIEGYGHTVGHVGCLPELVAGFFAAGTVDGLETSCATSLRPPPFELS